MELRMLEILEELSEDRSWSAKQLNDYTDLNLSMGEKQTYLSVLRKEGLIENTANETSSGANIYRRTEKGARFLEVLK